MKAIGHYKHLNPMRHNFWIHRAERTRWYTPTNASRARIARLIRHRQHYSAELYLVYFVA